jgi:hypothetical protein
MIVVALSGWKGSGKDTVAKFLVEKHGYKRVAFADVLKDMVAETYGLPRHYMDDPQHKESPILDMPVDPKDKFSEMIAGFMHKEFALVDGKPYWSPRALCILEGSVKRSADSNYWVSKAVSQMNNPRGKYVITDMRYRSELDKLKDITKKDDVKNQLITIRIKRFESSPSSDPSERDLDDTEMMFTLDNRDTISELENTVDLFNGYVEGYNV